MSRQWMAVLLLVAGLGVGVYALLRFSPDTAPLGVGSEAPDVDVVNLATGDTISLLDEYEGNVTLVNIWATWCVPCRVEMPAMQAVYDSLKDDGFRIAAVSIDEGSPEKVLAFTGELGLTFDILQDPDRSIERIYQTAGVPESFLLNKNGVIIKRIIGAQDWNSEVNRTLIRRLLGPGSEDPAPRAVEPVSPTADSTRQFELEQRP